MNKERADSIRNGSCLTREEMTDYVLGKSDAFEQHCIEYHLLECELCEDAMEALQDGISIENFQKADQNLKKEIDQMLDKEGEGRIRVLFPMRMAAAIALLLASTLVLWLVIPRKDVSTYITEEYKPYPAPADSSFTSESMQAASAQTVSDQQIPPHMGQATAQKQSGKHLYPKDTVIIDENIAERVIEPASSAGDVSTTLEKKETTEVPAREETADRVTHQYDSENAMPSQPKVRDASPSITTAEKSEPEMSLKRNVAVSNVRKNKETDQPSDIYFNTGMEAYRRNDYRTAIISLEKSNKTEAVFYLGVSYWLTDNPHTALSSFRKYLQSGEKTYREASWWYSALSYVKINDNRQAKKALTKVIEFHGEFEQQAKDLLKKL